MPSKGTLRTYVCAFCGTTIERRSRPAFGRAYCDNICSGKQSGVARRKATNPADIIRDGDSCRIPLYRRDGSISAYTVIDAADERLVTRWRWRLGTGGYAVRAERIDGVFRQFRLNRVLLGLDDRSEEGDHINRDRLNNRRSNLRSLSHQGNGQNKSSYTGTTSTYRGVSWHKRDKRWRADVKTNGKQFHIGTFATEEEAAEAARSWRSKLLPHAVD